MNILLYISRLPKTSIASILWAINTYLVAKGYIDPATATLVSSILVALGVSINIATNNGKIQERLTSLHKKDNE